MEAHKHLWTMYHAEPDLWLLLVVGRHLVGPDCLPSSLTGLLKGLHSLAALLHGLLSTQLDQVGWLAGRREGCVGRVSQWLCLSGCCRRR
jgi:hypothetical protein